MRDIYQVTSVRLQFRIQQTQHSFRLLHLCLTNTTNFSLILSPWHRPSADVVSSNQSVYELNLPASLAASIGMVAAATILFAGGLDGALG